AGLDGKHGVAHGGNDRIGDRGHGGNDAHGLGDEYHVGVEIFADDTARFLVLQVVPDVAVLAFVLEDLVLINADAGLVHSHTGQHLGIVEHVLADAFHNGVYLLL